MFHNEISIPKLKEYWVNVYEGGIIGYRQHSNVLKAIAYSGIDINNFPGGLISPIYRIHVKMKEVKGFNRDYHFKFHSVVDGNLIVNPIVKSNRSNYVKNTSKLNWMG